MELYRNTPLEELIVEDGTVVGAIVEHDGERRAIRARKGVVLAAGGFDQNDEMRGKYGVPARAGLDGPWSNLARPTEAGIAVGAGRGTLEWIRPWVVAGD